MYIATIPIAALLQPTLYICALKKTLFFSICNTSILNFGLSEKEMKVNKHFIKCYRMNMHVLLYACNNTIYIYLITFRYLIRNPKCLEHVSQVWITVHNKISKLSIITIYHFSNLFEIPINFEKFNA